MSETGEHPVTTDWLTEALRAGKILPHGSVEAVDVGCYFAVWDDDTSRFSLLPT